MLRALVCTYWVTKLGIQIQIPIPKLDVYYKCNYFMTCIFLESIKKQVKSKSASDHEIEEPLKIYLAQAPFADKRSNKTHKI